MQSSFEGDTTYVIPPASSPNIPPPPPVPVPIAPTVPISSYAKFDDYLPEQVVRFAERIEKLNQHMEVVAQSSNPSPTPSFTLADLFTGDLSSTSHAINNLQALAKLGNSLGNQGIQFLHHQSLF